MAVKNTQKVKEGARLSKFSARLDALRKETGLSHLRIADAIGVERSTVSKIFKGVRSVSQWDRISLICRELCLSGSTVRSLRRIYELEYYGEDVQRRHAIFAKLMDNLDIARAPTSSVAAEVAMSGLPAADKGVQVFHGADAVLVLCRAVIIEHSSPENESLIRISSSVSVSEEVMRLLGASYVGQHSKLIIRHMISLESRSAEESCENFESICALVPLLLSNDCSYSVHYYYCNPGASSHNPYPVYIVSADRVVLIAPRFNHAVVITDPETVACYCQSFDRALTATTNIRADGKRSVQDICDACASADSSDIPDGVTFIEAMPPVSRLLDIDTLSGYLRVDNSELEGAVAMLKTICSKTADTVQYVTLEGLDWFADTGCCVAPPQYFVDVLPMSVRLKVLEVLREKIASGSGVRIVRSERLNVPLSCCVEHLAGCCVKFSMYDERDGMVRSLCVTEASTVKCMDSFVEHLSESLLTYDIEEALEQMDMRIAALSERL